MEDEKPAVSKGRKIKRIPRDEFHFSGYVYTQDAGNPNFEWDNSGFRGDGFEFDVDVNDYNIQVGGGDYLSHLYPPTTNTVFINGVPSTIISGATISIDEILPQNNITMHTSYGATGQKD